MTNDVLQKLKPAAIGLIVTGVLNILWAFFSIIYNLAVGLNFQPDFGSRAERSGYVVGNVIGFGILAVVSIAAPFIIYGAWQMMNGKSLGFAKTAAILAIIPFTSCCFLLGIPFGIWALVVLSKPEVRAVFTVEAPPPNYYPPQPPQNW